MAIASFPRPRLFLLASSLVFLVLLVACLVVASHEWFWADDLSSDAGDQGAAAGVVERWSASLTNWMGAHSGTIGLVLGGLIAITMLGSLLKRFEPVEVAPVEVAPVEVAPVDTAALESESL